MAAGTRPIGPGTSPGAMRLRAAYAALAIMLALAMAAALPILSNGLSGLSSGSMDLVVRAGWFTIVQAGLSTLASLAMAVPVALALLGLGDFPGRRLVLALFGIPLALPAIAAVAGILFLLGRNGLLARAGLPVFDQYGLAGIVFAHVFFNMPLGVRLLSKAFETVAEEQWKLAASLRFPPAARFRYVVWPVLRAALPGAAGLIFLLCAGSYTIILVLGGGPAATTLQVAIQQALAFDFDPPKAAALTLAQLALTALMFALLPDAGLPIGGAVSDRAQRWRRRQFGPTLAAALMVISGVTLVGAPLLAIGMAGAGADHLRLLATPGVWAALAASLGIALAAATLALAGALALAAGEAALRQQGRDRSATILVRSATAFLGLPALLLGVGWFILLAGLGQPYGFAPVMIVLANALMALPFALQLARPAVAAHLGATDRLCAALGLSGVNRMRLIDWPALRRPLAPAFALAMALSLGDLGVVTLYGSDRITTLPSLIYQSIGSYRTHDAAGLVLYLTLITGLLAAFGTGRARHGG